MPAAEKVALGPVAGDHERGLVGLDQCQGVVPFAVAAAGIGILADLTHRFEGVPHRFAAGRRRVMIDKDLAIHLLTADPGQGGVEQPSRLLGVATHRDRQIAGGLDLVGLRQELVPGLGRRHIQIPENLGAVPHPVSAVQIDRDGDHMTVDSDILDQQRRQVPAPIAGFGQIVEIGQEPLFGELADGDPDVPLKRGRRMAAGNRVQHRGMLRLRPDRGAVDPFAAALLVLLGEHRDRL